MSAKSSSPIQIAKKVLHGTMLGDACIDTAYTSTGKGKLYLVHSTKQFPYLLWKMQMLYPLVGDFYVKFVGPCVHAVSRTQTYLHHVHQDLYVKEGKIVPLNYLRRCTPLSLACWYMDDGSLYYGPKHLKGVRLATYGFSQYDHQNMKQYFQENWGLDVVVDSRNQNGKVYQFLRMRKKVAEGFLDLIREYVHPFFAYKLDPSLRSAEHVIPREEIVRTLQQCGELVRNNQPGAKWTNVINWSEWVKGPRAKHNRIFRAA